MTAGEKRSAFGERLRELRAKAELSQPALAERADLPVGTIRHFEQGRREPTYGTLVKLATGLGVSLSAFDVAADEPRAKPPTRTAATKVVAGKAKLKKKS
jgi:transcriptional regulator with XRE-family HTH domain